VARSRVAPRFAHGRLRERATRRASALPIGGLTKNRQLLLRRLIELLRLRLADKEALDLFRQRFRIYTA
jgi:hypothetical protein